MKKSTETKIARAEKALYEAEKAYWTENATAEFSDLREWSIENLATLELAKEYREDGLITFSEFIYTINYMHNPRRFEED